MSAPPLSIHGGNLAKEAVAVLMPEGVLLAPLWKRAVAFSLDVLLISILINLLTGGGFSSVLIYLQNPASKHTSYWFFFLLLHTDIHCL